MITCPLLCVRCCHYFCMSLSHLKRTAGTFIHLSCGHTALFACLLLCAYHSSARCVGGCGRDHLRLRRMLKAVWQGFKRPHRQEYKHSFFLLTMSPSITTHTLLCDCASVTSPHLLLTSPIHSHLLRCFLTAQLPQAGVEPQGPHTRST